MIKELLIDKEETKEIFVNAFKEANLVPIIGAGFTVNMPAQDKNTVPDGKIFKEYMINKIVNKQKEICKDELKKESFSSVAELFESNYGDIKKEDVSKYFYDHFTGVKINKYNQLRFLNEIDWEYIYTLNIDNGIESSNRERWEIFYPNKDFDERNDFKGKKKLYKIHGDANRFIKTLDYNEMILTESQYIYSLDKNKKFHDMLASDCENKNVIYIGCSLDDEIDIKYSVLSDKNRNYNDRETYRIYVTTDSMSPLKKAKLEGFNVSHYIQLQKKEDYELFYEFMVECYNESVEGINYNIENYAYQSPSKLGKDTEANIKYLADLGSSKNVLPYYYFESDLISKMEFSTEKINVISGRRFVGKTLLAYNILEHYQNYKRYFIKSQDSVDIQIIHELMSMRKALIVFDSDSIDDRNFIEIINSFQKDNNNIVCIFVNSYDDILNLISYHSKNINQPVDHNLIGKMSVNDITKINKGLDDIGIAKFNEKNNILDNTLRISNLYRTNLVSNYTITSKEELQIIIWLLAQNKIYYEELVSLGLSRKYKDIVRKYAPFLQEEKCKYSEIRKHSRLKVVCNGKLGLLQILNNYAYPSDNNIGKTVAKSRHRDICNSIYSIMYSFEKIDRDIVKKFIMFDTLNDIFSRKYSQQSINFISSNGEEGKSVHGAAGLIQQIYSDDKIKQLKSDDPNYWLQRAKSVYITYYKQNNIFELYEGIQWAIKAEQDSLIKIQEGERQYKRTMSNATIQIAIMYGRVARMNEYKNISDNSKAVEYYYKGLSDVNNSAAAKSIICNNSKGTEDFHNLISILGTNKNAIDQEWNVERDYLLKIGIGNNISYSL